MPRRLDHPRDDDGREIVAQQRHAVDGGDVRREEIVQFLRRLIVRNEGAKPSVRSEHQENCSRKRTSES